MATKTKKKYGNYDLRIINIGFPRCGTSSLSSALQILGYNTWHLETNNPFETNRSYQWFKGKLFKIRQGEYVDFDEFFEMTQVNVAMDAPFIAIWKELVTFYPNAKIIVCIRDDYDKWKSSLTSAVKWLIESKILSALGYIWFSFIFSFRFEFMKILKEEWIDQITSNQQYLQRIEEIKTFINDDKRLLILNLKTIKEKQWLPLCKFLDVPIPENRPYPLNNYRGKMMKRARNGLLQFIFGLLILPILISTLNSYYY